MAVKASHLPRPCKQSNSLANYDDLSRALKKQSLAPLRLHHHAPHAQFPRMGWVLFHSLQVVFYLTTQPLIHTDTRTHTQCAATRDVQTDEAGGRVEAADYAVAVSA